MRSLPVLLVISVLAGCGLELGAPEPDGLGDPGSDGGGSDGGGSDGGGSAGADGSGGDEEPAALAGTLEAHNEARAAVGVGPLVWDAELAAIAQAWADRCVDDDGNGLVDHNKDRSDGYPTYVGENIYGSSGTASGPAAVQAWVDEKADYDYGSNSCSAVCGHYTQVVWSTTTHVGCAVSDCENLRYSSSLVCNYGPGGNISGRRPY